MKISIPMFFPSITKTRVIAWLVLSLLGLMPLTSQAGAFTSGNLAVLRADSIANNTTASIIEINTTTANQTAVQTISVSGTGTDAIRISGSATSTGYLSRTNDKTLLNFNGANSIATTNVSGLNPRAVVSLDSTGTISLKATYTGTSGNQTRSSTSLDNSTWFIADQGGIYTNSATTASPTGNFRGIKAFDGVVYAGQTSSTTTTIQVSTVSAASSGVITGLPTLTNNNNLADFYLIQSGSNGTSYDVLYTISSTSATAGTIAKYSLVSGSWLANGTYTTNFGGFGLAVEKAGSGAYLYVTTGGGATGANSVIKLEDTAGYNTQIAITTTNNITLFTSASGMTLKGIDFAPIGSSDTPPTISSTTPANNATNIATNSTIVLNFNENVDLTTSAVTLECPNGTAKTFTGSPASNVNTVTLTPSATLPSSTICAVTVDKTQVTDKDGTADNMTANYSFSFTTETAAIGSPPTITFNTTTNDLIDGAATTISSPFAVTGTIGTTDSTDPMRTLGINFTIADSDTTIASVTVTATSSNTTVVPAGNIIVTGSGTADVNIKIQGVAVGYSDITVTANDGNNTATFVIKYAASTAGMTTSRYHSGKADASTAIALDSDYMLVADDEDQTIRLYDRNKSGLPLKSFDLTSSLNLTNTSGGVPREVDIEGSTRVGNDIYWLASHSNSSGGSSRPNRYRLIRTALSGTGASSTLTYTSYYSNLRSDLITWGDAKGYNFTTSAATGKAPELVDGFNIEGFTIAPDTTTAFIGFRAPQVPTTGRVKALIAPISNFTTWANGNFATAPTLGNPIELDLGGRGIRSMECNSNGCLIIARASDGAGNFKLYRWSGNAADAPVMMGTDLSTTAITGGGNDGSFESIVQLPNGAMNNWVNQTVQLLLDNGDTKYYDATTVAKNLTQANHKKFRSEIVTLTAAPASSCNKSNATHCIHEIQGSGSAMTTGLPTSVTVEGIVIADYQEPVGSIKGFFVQEEANEVDANSMTSEGIFVYCDSCPTAVNVGDKVRVTGSASEFNNMSQITPTAAVTVVNSGNALPTPATLTFPISSAFASKDAYLEQFEGMLVKINGTLTVVENYQLGRFGQVTLAAGTRPQQFTHANAPSTSGYTAHKDTVTRQIIVLDDASNAQNPDPTIYPQNNLSANNSLRSGSTINNLTGVLHWSWGGNASSSDTWRIRPVTGQSWNYNFTQAPRPTTPPSVGTTHVRVASFNLLNYFNTFGTGNCTNGVSGAATDCRGANDATEFTRQKDKHKQVVIGLNADVIGLMELENDGYGSTSAQQDLRNLINSVGLSGRNYKMVDADALIGSANSLGTDAIKIGLIYDDNAVELVAGSVKTSNNAIFERRPLAATFKHKTSNEKFTVVVNHLKSKGSAGSLTGDTDQNDGQGNSNATRVAQAQALVTFLATLTDDPDILVMGDMNAYAQEAPMTTIKNAGYTDLLGTSKYSYVFDGQIGYLDHALASSSLVPQVTGADDWHINSDEPSVLDYNTEFKSTGQITSFYAANPFRSSDHDPVLIGLNLGKYTSTTSPNSPSYTVIVQTAGNGTGQVEQTAIPTTGSAKLQLKAVADANSRFVGWSERFAPECVGNNPIVTVTVNAIKTCIATFEKIPPRTQTINFAPLPAKQLGDPDFSLVATATSGLMVTFNSTTPTICSVNQNTVHLNNSGTCHITAQQLGNNQYLAAIPVSQSFNIAPRTNPTTGTGNSSTGGNTSSGTGSVIPSQLRGISANGYVDQQPLIVGLFSSGKQQVLIRASGVFQDIDPKISVFSYPNRKLLASNDNWNSATSAAELQQKQLAPTRQTDAGMIVELPEGLLTVEMIATVSGVGIVEVYDLGVFDHSSTSYAFKGFSVNATLHDYPIIAGLLVTGDKKRMLLRAMALETGIDPELEVFSYPDRRLLATNYRWATSTAQLELQQKQLVPPRETDAATVTELSQGLLTVEVTKARNTHSGRSIVEIYEMTVFH